ncbi:Penicillin-binding protein 4* [Roseimaritima ulvae]|uniref:Penicillin-binding protein 4 n=2 Tax=Roseimaritima ulvae TaxID=980254 RepID=A0A5B9QNX1_9BACT|nr:Penicillin-binding protein 4* [Roseimaritima ulvae]
MCIHHCIRLTLLFACLVPTLLLSGTVHGEDAATHTAGETTPDPTAALIQAAIDDGQMAGAVVMMSQQGKLVYSTAIGDAQVEPQRRPMRLDTVFDLASLTKPVATATSIMNLVDQDKLELDTKIASLFPEFGEHGKQDITVADLLLHRGGLIADNALRDYGNDQQNNWANICRLKPLAEPGERFIYSDVGFIVLGKVVEKVSGQPLDQFVRQNLYAPLQMTETMYTPSASLRARAAATEKQGDQWLVGRVHDPRAARMNGVAGHAGLFSTAADLIRFGEAFCNGGATDDARILGTETVAMMTQPREVPGGQRAFGWDVRSRYSSNRPEGFSEAAFGHGGFTGTVLWIDPQQEVVFVFLSNRLHPDGKGSVNKLAAQVADQLLERFVQP